MRVEINNSKVLNIVEQCLIIKNNKLFNASTEEYEAIDGDRIVFSIIDSKGERHWVEGIVDGYTCHRRIKLKGHTDLYAASENCGKVIERNSTITDTDYVAPKEEVITESKKVQDDEDWELVLGAC